MSLGKNAFKETGLLIFGRTPLAPARLEQSIAAAVPDIEVQLESYEDYDDALDYTKAKKDVGFFFLLEDGKNPSSADVFSNLAKPFSVTGWPAWSVLIYQDKKTMDGFSQILSNKSIIDYLPLANFTDVNACRSQIEEIGKKIISKTTDFLLPERLQTVILSLASGLVPKGSLSFMEQAANILLPNIDLSWRESVQLKWSYPLTNIKKFNSTFFQSNNDLDLLFCTLEKTYSTFESLVVIQKDRTIPLLIRIYNLLLFLNEERAAGDLSSSLTKLSDLGVPGAPIIFRTLKKSRENILKVANQTKAAA